MGSHPSLLQTSPSYQESYRTINARDDTILSPQRSMWHPLLSSQRCVIFCQGFYEWQKKSTASSNDLERISHFVGMSESGTGRTDKNGKGHKLMARAGLWEKVKFEGEKEEVYSFTIVTTASNEQLGFLHDMMPAILKDAADVQLWLGLGRKGSGKDQDDTWSQEVARLLRPLKGELDCYKVPREVGKVGNSDPSFILPIEDRKDELRAFFSKQKEAKSSEQVGSEKEESNFDVETSKAAAKVEDDAALQEALTRTEQEEDRKLAQKLQQEWQQGEDLMVKAVDVGDGSPVPSKRQASQSPQAETSDTSTKRQKVKGSSRFSPDPFDPLNSPPRPKGGYSRDGQDFGNSPRKSKKKEVESGPMDKMLEKQRKKAEKEPDRKGPALLPLERRTNRIFALFSRQDEHPTR